MQKKLIALAIAGLSGAAFAQSNVTIYGVADATFDNVRANSSFAGGATNEGNRNRITMNSSYFGLKGTEDLGGGMKAFFQIESAIGENGTPATSTPGATTYGLANRDTFVGIEGGFGKVQFGNFTGPTRLVGYLADVNAGGTGIGANAALLGKVGGGNGASVFDQRISNAVAYISPTWSGFHFAIGYMANENRSTGDNPASKIAAWDTGAVYMNGPITAALTFETLKDSGTGSSVPTGIQGAMEKANDTRALFKYNFGNWTLGALYDRVKLYPAAGSDMRRTAWYIPLTYTMGAGKIIAQYGHAGDVDNLAGDQKANHFVLGYEHSLSKRTLVKVVYSQITNKDAANYDYLYGTKSGASNGTTTSVAGSPAVGADPRGLSVGVRHTF